MSLDQTSTTSFRHPEKNDESLEHKENRAYKERLWSSMDPPDDPQAMLEQAIRDGQTRQIVTLIRHTKVSLNHREVTHDLQTPLMRLCHANLRPVQEPESNLQSLQNDFAKAELDKLCHGLSTAAAEAASDLSSVATLKVLNEVDALHFAEARQHEAVNLDGKDALDRTLAMHACVSQNVVVLSWVLTRGCSLLAADRKGRNVLHYAACSGSDAIVDLALDHVDALNALQTLDFQGYSPLDMARQSRHASAVKKLGAALRSKTPGDQSSDSIPATVMPTKDNSKTQHFLQARKSLHSHCSSRGEDSTNQAIATEPRSPQAQGGVRSSPNGTSVLNPIRLSTADVNSIPSPFKMVNKKQMSPNKLLEPVNQLQVNSDAYQPDHSSIHTQNTLLPSPHSYKKQGIDLKIHTEDQQLLGISSGEPPPSVTTELLKVPLASIPTQADKSSPDESPTRIETNIIRHPLAPCSSPRRIGTPVDRKQPFSPCPRQDSEYRQDSVGMSSGHGLAKVKKYDQAVEALLSPHRSPQQRQKALMYRDNQSRLTISQGETASNYKDTSATQQQDKSKFGLLAKRQQQPSNEKNGIVIFYEGIEDASTPDSSETSYVFEEEIVLDTPRVSERHEGNSHNGGVTGSKLQQQQLEVRERRDSLSLPDLRDMTGQLVTSRETSPIFCSSRSDLVSVYQKDKTWAVKTPRGRRNKDMTEISLDQHEDNHNRSYKDNSFRAQPSNSSTFHQASGQHHRNTDQRKKHYTDVRQRDMGDSLPIIKIGTSDKD